MKLVKLGLWWTKKGTFGAVEGLANKLPSVSELYILRVLTKSVSWSLVLSGCIRKGEVGKDPDSSPMHISSVTDVKGTTYTCELCLAPMLVCALQTGVILQIPELVWVLKTVKLYAFLAIHSLQNLPVKLGKF